MIDVRSPSEYKHGHIIGAQNVPLFTDEERKIVGTAYKEEGRKQAIKIGLDFFGPRMRKIVEEVERLMSNWQLAAGNAANDQLPTFNSVFLYCWRGGMRSAAVAWLLDLYGFKVAVLESGYKAYRNFVLQTFTLSIKFKVIGGFTGSGKTEILQELEQRGENTIDLEKLSSHKGSAFGNINMPAQPTQEMFENLLAKEINKCTNSPSRDRGIWIEDESQRIGLINIPSALWQQIRRSSVYFFDIPFEERLKHITEEYGCFNKRILADAVVRISKRLGGLETKNALNYLEEGNISACFSILLKYYDKQYLKGLHNRDNLASLLHQLPGIAVNPNNAAMLTTNSISV